MSIFLHTVFRHIRHFPPIPRAFHVPFLVRFNAGPLDIWNKMGRNVKSAAGTRTWVLMYVLENDSRSKMKTVERILVHSHLEESPGEKYHRF